MGDLPSARQFQQQITSFRGHSAAVVYGFAPAGQFTQICYDQWRSYVISPYGSPLEELGLHPYFVDAVAFARQALDGSLPKVVCAFNLNTGITPIYHWSMVPSVASWCGIKPFPSEADVLIVSERKGHCQPYRARMQFRRPKELSQRRTALAHPRYLVHPTTIGSSRKFIDLT